MSVSALQTILGYQFKQPELLQQALSHRSYRQTDHNERLEFLGDSILGLVISEYIYQRLPLSDEGALSRVRASLVKEDTLADIAREIALGDYLYLGGGELKSGCFQRASILSDALEAIIGAIYLDSDFAQVSAVVLGLYRDRLVTLPDAQSLKDPKTRLQELVQSQQADLPSYVLLQTVGKSHNPVFTVKCEVASLAVEAIAQAESRRKAEQAAAADVLGQLVS